MGKVEDAQTANCLLNENNVYGVRNNQVNILKYFYRFYYLIFVKKL